MPHLLPEIRSMVLGEHDDLTHLWNTCRLVSTEFKQLTERIFVTRYLPRTTIFFLCNRSMVYHTIDAKVHLTAQPERFHFLHVIDVDSKQKAVFTSGRVGDNETAPMQHMARLMQDDALRYMVINLEHTVGIGQEVNDVHLPGLCVDAKLGRLEFDWKEFMSIFYAEEALFRKVLSRMEPGTATIPKSDYTISTTPSSSSAATPEECIRCLAHLGIHYERVQPPFNSLLTRAGCAKVAARHARLTHFYPAIVRQPLGVDKTYIIKAQWSQWRDILCKQLLDAEAAESEEGSRAEAAEVDA